MIRTYSLRRLMIGITILCVVAGLAVNFPAQTLAAAMIAAYFLPAIAICYLFTLRNRRRVLVNVIGLAGAAIGFLAMPRIMSNPPLTFWDEFLQQYVSVAV